MRWWFIPGGKQKLLAAWKCFCGDAVQQTFHFKGSTRHISTLSPRAGSTCRVFIVAGESSGDAIGSRLMASLRYLSPQTLEFAGVGGPLMEKEGFHSEFPMEDISVMGLVELIPHSFRLWRRLRETVSAAVTFKPDLVITVDSKGFSFRVHRGITEAYAAEGRPRPLAVHYVAPSFWGWKGGEQKLKGLSKIVDHLLCILPFEDAICRASGVGATFVGHPVLEEASVVSADREFQNGSSRSSRGVRFRKQYGLETGCTLLSVLPGSRLQEVQRMLPIFEEAVNLLQKSVTDLKVVMPTPQLGLVSRRVEELVAHWRVPVLVLPAASDTDKYNLFSAGNAALCTSGTAVLQAHLACVPCVAAYRAHPLTEFFIRRRTRLKYISLPNILLNAPVIPEALFGSCTAGQIVSYLRAVIEDEDLQNKQLLTVEKVKELLTPPISEMPRSSRLTASTPEISTLFRTPSIVAASCILRLLEGSQISRQS
ncbi:hypothetical protein R1sor_022950 [Riccia sorocarpa]|uniref:lipid-A-disaccharide synthase n=1 Tax=Riccia sorocarpa TaxID=122646 RepID=A0ABD3GNI6_9MARC